jgi:hypothetical protein
MREVPQVVRGRLRVSSFVGGNPDPDVLTAFAERLLQPVEREVVLEHLGRCGDCREILALALPASEAVDVAPARRKTGISLGWPALRWGVVVAAGIIAVISLRVQYRAHPAPQGTIAQLKSPAGDSGSVSQTRASTDIPSAQAKKQESSGPANAATAIRANATSLPSMSTARSDSADKAIDAVLDSQPKVAMNEPPAGLVPAREAKKASADMGAPAATEFSQLSRAASSPAAAPAPGETLTAGVSQQPLPSIQTTGLMRDEVVGKAKAPTSPAATGGAHPAPPGVPYNYSALMKTSREPAARWSIGDGGSLQRSFDGGRTWQGVSVSAKSDLARFAAAGVGEKEIRSKDASNKAAASEEAPSKEQTSMASATANPVFHAVAVSGFEVWAGGSAGMLYHSADGGEHWARVVPSTPVASLQSDIVTLEFVDAQHGTITTSTSEVWTTADGGRSWQKH